MSRPINISDSVKLIPNSYTNTGSYNFTNQTINNAYTDADSTSSNRMTLTRSSSSTRKSEIYYEFNKSSLTNIPSNATITSITANVKYYVNSTTYVTAVSIQLCSNTTKKGSAVTSRPTSGTKYAITTGSWTRAELDNIRLYVSGTHNASNSNGYIYFYGADVTINYSISGTEYEITSTLATDKIDEIDPAGVTAVMGGNGYELRIDGASIDEISVEDNGVDVTSSLVRHNNVAGTQTFTGIPTSFDSTNSVYNTTAGDSGNGIYSTNYITNGLTDHTSSTRCALYAVQGSGSTSYMYYNFDCSSIPANAVINNVTCQFKGGTQGSSYYSSYTAQLTTGTTLKGSSTSVTGSNSSPSTVTINGGTSWTRAELNNIKIKFQVVRGSSNTTTDSTWSFFGATLTVTYTIPAENPYYWTYSLSNVQADHTIIIGDSFIEIPDEDPQYNYYPITISSINATTEPVKGTTRVIEGTNQTITIYPTDPLVTLITDNGVDVSNQLVSHNAGSPSYTVTTQVSGASYGFPLNSSTGYYTSNNSGQESSAAVCRVNFSLPVSCLVTVKYINYGEATYDFGVFSKVDTALSTSGWTSSSNSGDTTTDAGNEQIRLNTSAANTQTEQTLIYEIPAGEHFIDVKYGKDQASDTSPDNLRFKIDSITPLEANNYYTYSLSNVNEAHSLIFIFGNVTYYFVNSSSNGPKLYPNGQFVVLPGDSYKLVIVPEDYDDTITVTDNNTDVTNSLQQVTTEIEKDGETITAINYIYRLSNINATHTIEVTKAGSSDVVYLKVNGSWRSCSKVYKKVNNVWVEQTNFSNLFDSNKIYIKV